jgi:hypothetical protein
MVRLIAFILSIFVLVLSTMPCCNVGHEASEKYCTEKQSGTNSQQQDDDCGSNCSPFYSCGTCVGFTFASSYQFIKPVILAPGLSKLIPYQKNFSAGFYGKVWQPPKIA